MAVHVEGLRELTRSLEQAGVDVDELKDVMGAVAAEAANVMTGFIPSRSGRLRGTVRGNRAKGKATVTIGSARVQYARVINYGWPARGIRAARFTEQTDTAMELKAVDMLEAGWNTIAERHGLT